MLFAEVDGRGPRVVLVHGFTQTRRSWGEIAVDLAHDHEVVRVDAPGHGRSGSLALDMVEGADALAEAGGRAVYLGYSMGARLCLHTALAHPDLVQALVLVGATAGIDDGDARAARRRDDEVLASEIERIGVGEFLERWLAKPLFAGLSAGAAGLEARLENTAAGLAASLRLAGTGAQEPLRARLGTLEMPVLAVAGGRDEAFVRRAEEIATAIGPNAEVALVPGAGHAAHLEAPGTFLAVVRPFLLRAVAGARIPS